MIWKQIVAQRSRHATGSTTELEDSSETRNSKLGFVHPGDQHRLSVQVDLHIDKQQSRFLNSRLPLLNLPN